MAQQWRFYYASRPCAHQEFGQRMLLLHSGQGRSREDSWLGEMWMAGAGILSGGLFNHMSGAWAMTTWKLGLAGIVDHY